MFSYTRPLITTIIIFLSAIGMGPYPGYSSLSDSTLHKSVPCEPALAVNMCEDLSIGSMETGQLSLLGNGKYKKTTIKHKTARRKTIRKKTAPLLCAGMDL
jgi:hypothetical protein